MEAFLPTVPLQPTLGLWISITAPFLSSVPPFPTELSAGLWNKQRIKYFKHMNTASHECQGARERLSFVLQTPKLLRFSGTRPCPCSRCDPCYSNSCRIAKDPLILRPSILLITSNTRNAMNAPRRTHHMLTPQRQNPCTFERVYFSKHYRSSLSVSVLFYCLLLRP